MSLFFLKRGLAYYFIIITICNDRHKEVARTRMAPRIFFGIRLGLGWEGEWAHSETKKRRPSGLGRTAAFLGYGNTSFGKRFFRYLPYVKGFLLGSKLITWCLATSLDLAPFSVTPSSISSQDVAGKVTKDKPVRVMEGRSSNPWGMSHTPAATGSSPK